MRIRAEIPFGALKLTGTNGKIEGRYYQEKIKSFARHMSNSITLIDLPDKDTSIFFPSTALLLPQTSLKIVKQKIRSHRWREWKCRTWQPLHERCDVREMPENFCLISSRSHNNFWRWFAAIENQSLQLAVEGHCSGLFLKGFRVTVGFLRLKWASQ